MWQLSMHRCTFTWEQSCPKHRVWDTLSAAGRNRFGWEIALVPPRVLDVRKTPPLSFQTLVVVELSGIYYSGALEIRPSSWALSLHLSRDKEDFMIAQGYL